VADDSFVSFVNTDVRVANDLGFSIGIEEEKSGDHMVTAEDSGWLTKPGRMVIVLISVGDTFLVRKSSAAWACWSEVSAPLRTEVVMAGDGSIGEGQKVRCIWLLGLNCEGNKCDGK
jgi:hypothetical protein